MPFVREHVGAFVRGRGPVPTLRIGRQPYGVLPILASSQWNRTPGEPEQLTRLHDVLGVARAFFEPAAAGLPRLHSVADTTTEMVRILGLSPVPHPGGYAVRDVVGRAASIIFMMDQAAPVAAHANESNAELVRLVAETGRLNADITLPSYRFLMALTLGDLIHGTEMEWLALNGVKPMRVPVARTDKNRHGWESPPTYLSRLCRDVIDLFLIVQPQQAARPHDLLFVLAEHALALAGELDSIRILGAANARAVQPGRLRAHRGRGHTAARGSRLRNGHDQPPLPDRRGGGCPAAAGRDHHQPGVRRRQARRPPRRAEPPARARQRFRRHPRRHPGAGRRGAQRR